MPLESFKENTACIKSESLDYDPSLLILYVELKNSLKNMRITELMVDYDRELEFIYNVATSYDRMGCPILALEIIKKYPIQFDKDKKSNVKTNNQIVVPEIHWSESSYASRADEEYKSTLENDDDQSYLQIDECDSMTEVHDHSSLIGKPYHSPSTLNVEKEMPESISQTIIRSNILMYQWHLGMHLIQVNNYSYKI